MVLYFQTPTTSDNGKGHAVAVTRVWWAKYPNPVEIRVSGIDSEAAERKLRNLLSNNGRDNVEEIKPEAPHTI